MSRIAYISGRPGAGKSSLAIPLAAELGYSLVIKDLVKETLHDALHVPGEGEIDRTWSRRLNTASWELLWMLAAHAGDMVIEANFHPPADNELGKLRGLGARMVEVHCACPAEVAHARYNARSRHQAHSGTLPLSAMGQIRPAGRHRPADHRGHDRAGRRHGCRRRDPPPAHQLTLWYAFDTTTRQEPPSAATSRKTKNAASPCFPGGDGVLFLALSGRCSIHANRADMTPSTGQGSDSTQARDKSESFLHQKAHASGSLNSAD